jgi:hypothetical protein
MNDSIAAAKLVSNKIREYKSLSKALKAMQVSGGVAQPLGVFLSGNTRKWSSGYLMISRIVRLRPFLMALQATDEWQRALGDFRIDFDSMEASLEILFRFYVFEEVLQRDSSSAIHLAFCWRKVRDLVADAKLIMLHLDMDRAFNNRDALMRSCQFLDLFLCLWPDDSILEGADKFSGANQLIKLIDKMWPAVQRHPKAVCLPLCISTRERWTRMPTDWTTSRHVVLIN